MLTQRNLARYLVEQRAAPCLFTVKDNPPTLLADIRLLFEVRGKADVRESFTLEHGRLESRDLDHHPAQRLSELSLRRTSLRRRAPEPPEDDRQGLHRNRLWLPEAASYLKQGIPFQDLDAIAYAITDNEAAKHLNEAKQKLFKTIYEEGKRVA